MKEYSRATIRLEKKLKVQANQKAKNMDITLSQYVRKLIRADLGINAPS